MGSCKNQARLLSVCKQASENRQGFTRQRLCVQGRTLEAQGTGPRREVREAPSGSPKWLVRLSRGEGGGMGWGDNGLGTPLMFEH